MPTQIAADLLTLRSATAPKGKPDWANQVADPTPAAQADALCGPGLYALLLDGALFYIGLHVGRQAEPGYSVMQRWHKHVVGQTLRSPRISFARTALRRLFDLLPDHPVTDALAACLPDGRAQDLSRPVDHPLLKGSHCTLQKALFAARHWDVFGPGGEATMLDRIACLFVPVPAGWNERLAGATGNARGDWVREQWLRPVETDLVHRFRPACNAQTAIGAARDDVGPAEVEAAMTAGLAGALTPFDNAAYAALLKQEEEVPTAVIDAYDLAGGDEPLDPEVEENALEEGASRQMLGFRTALTPDQARYVAALADIVPAAFDLYPTGTPDLRITRAGERRPLLLLATADGRFLCSTRPDVDTCEKLGFAGAETVENNTMEARFYIDPAVDAPGALLPLIGASLLWRLGGRPG